MPKCLSVDSYQTVFYKSLKKNVRFIKKLVLKSILTVNTMKVGQLSLVLQ